MTSRSTYAGAVPSSGDCAEGRAARRAPAARRGTGRFRSARPVLGLSIRRPRPAPRSSPRERVRAAGCSRRGRASSRTSPAEPLARSCDRRARTLRICDVQVTRSSPQPCTAYRPEREDEVLRRDRDSVAPARLGADVVGQRERSLPRERRPCETRLCRVREVGTDLERRLAEPSRDPEPCGRSSCSSSDQNVETRGLDAKPAKTTVPPRFGVCAPAPPAPETARSETTIAALLALEPPVLRVPRAGRRRRDDSSESSIATPPTGDARTAGSPVRPSPSARRLDSGRGLLLGVEDPFRLIEIGWSPVAGSSRYSSGRLRSRRWTSPRGSPGRSSTRSSATSNAPLGRICSKNDRSGAKTRLRPRRPPAEAAPGSSSTTRARSQRE